MKTRNGGVKIIFSRLHFSNQNPRQMVHLVLDDLGREACELQSLLLEILVLEFHCTIVVLPEGEHKMIYCFVLP